MPRLGRGWKECGFDNSPAARKPRTRKVWLEVYVGRCISRLNELEAKGLHESVLKPLRDWMLDPNWIGDR